MRFWSATGENPDELTLISDDPPEQVRASAAYQKAVKQARKELGKKPGRITISHHDNDPDDQVTVVVERL